MDDKESKHIAIIFGKEENELFNRFTFPIFGRPVAVYPLLASLNAKKIDEVFLSSDSQGLLNIGKNLNGIRLLERKKSQATITEEVRVAVKSAVEILGYTPETVTILLANSPCVNLSNIDEAITFLENNHGYDSVATAMKRAEFNPTRIFSLSSQKELVKNELKTTSPSDDIYFLDRRLMVVKTKTLLSSVVSNDYFEGVLGSRIHPIIQQDGIWDIDYIWQVPIVERWLKQNGFTEKETPYDSLTKKTVHKNVSDIALKSGTSSEVLFRVLITTVPFGEVDSRSLELLKSAHNIEYTINPLGRKLKADELAELIKEFDIVIAGTEPITRKVLENGKKMKLISRVGIGLDSVDLKAARDLGINVSYTPDAPSPAVAELTIAHMLNMLRRVPLIDRKLRAGIWQRIQGERIANMTIGIIGTGRVGSRVLKHLQGFNPKRILVNDLAPDKNLYEMYHAEFAEKEKIYSESDIITLHVPLTSVTHNLVTSNEINLMKKNVCLINTSRGGIINEADLYRALSEKRIDAAAIDVFENEPYSGNLVELDNCYLSCHMGSMTNDCRGAMEIQATEEALRLIKGEKLTNLVPEEEYGNQLLK